MKRYLSIILFFVVLVAPFVVRQVVARKPGDVEPVKSDAKPAGELVIVTPHNQDIRRAFAAAFSDWHVKQFGAPVKITYLTPGGTNDITRLLSDKYDKQRAPLKEGERYGALPPEDKTAIDIDMVWGGGDVVFDVDLKSRGILKPVNVPRDVFIVAFPKPDIAGVPLYEPADKAHPDRQPRWVGTALSAFGMIYSPPLFETLGLPKPTRWEDLASPKLAGFVAGTDPMRSGSVAAAYMTILQRAMVDAEEALFASRPDIKAMPKADREKNADYKAAIDKGWKTGMGTLLLMAANARYFTDSGSQPCNDVGNGEAAAGVAIDFFARVNEEEIGQDRIKYLAPKGASAINADPIAILYGVLGERETLSNRFVTYLLTPEAQRLWNLRGGVSPYLQRSLRRLPIVQSVYADRTGWADLDVNPFEDAGGFNTRADWSKQLFSDSRLVWTASWIDARGALKESYKKILDVPDDALRAALVAELADIPMTMDQILAMRARGERINQKKDPEESDARFWRAKMRVEIAKKFREHYRSVAARAVTK
jgi:iron(III) transport system substrate-binding protein